MLTTIISTVSHNVGDDFVREGIASLLADLEPAMEIEVLHKHSPVTGNYGAEHIRDLQRSNRLEPVLRAIRWPNRITKADLLVQSGAPVYWCHDGAHCAENEWFEPLIRRRFLRDRRSRKFLNIAGGSCQRFHSDGTDICEQCRDYIAELYDVCDLTLLRDGVARSMLNAAGRDAKVLPCTSIFARDRIGVRPQPGEFIVLNFMENGGHYTFGQDIDAERWRRTFVELAREVTKLGRVVVACHSVAEEELARRFVPDVERFNVPHDHKAFMEFYARAKWGILNRVHGAFMMASLGKPAVVVGNDTRARMVSEIGLPSYYVSDVDPSMFDGIIEAARVRCRQYPEEMEDMRISVRVAYLEAISAALED